MDTNKRAEQQRASSRTYYARQQAKVGKAVKPHQAYPKLAIDATNETILAAQQRMESKLDILLDIITHPNQQASTTNQFNK
jgi:hypothetical protein